MSSRRVITGLAFVAIMTSVMLAVRIIGMTADSTVQENLHLVHAEIGLFVFTGIGLFAELGRHAHTGKTRLELQGAELR